MGLVDRWKALSSCDGYGGVACGIGGRGNGQGTVINGNGGQGVVVSGMDR